MKFSLLLSTLNRFDLMCICIDSLLKQSYTDYEIIIVDQSDVPVSKEWGSRIQYIHIDKKGLSNARNVGLQEAKGDYICLIDDDAVYEKDWLLKIEKVVKDCHIDVCCGRIKDPETGCYALSGSRNIPIDDVGFFQILKYGMSACSIFKADMLKKIGFDIDFGVGGKWGAGEETDVIWQIMEQGGKVSYNPEIIVSHKVSSTVDISDEKLMDYNRGFGALYAKHYRNCNNKAVYWFYHYSCMRNVAGIIINMLRLRKEAAHKQLIKLKGKKEGFREYGNT